MIEKLTCDNRWHSKSCCASLRWRAHPPGSVCRRHSESKIGGRTSHKPAGPEGAKWALFNTTWDHTAHLQLYLHWIHVYLPCPRLKTHSCYTLLGMDELLSTTGNNNTVHPLNYIAVNVLIWFWHIVIHFIYFIFLPKSHLHNRFLLKLNKTVFQWAFCLNMKQRTRTVLNVEFTDDSLKRPKLL